MVTLSPGLLAELGGWPALKEARQLVATGKVRDALQEGALVRGRVQGAEKIYEAQITLGERVAEVTVRCTCIESKKSGRVCAHALAVGLAMLEPAKVAPAARAAQVNVAKPSGPRRWLLDEAPPDAPQVELTFLLPLHLREALARDTVQIVLEGALVGAGVTRPWEALGRDLAGGFAVGEEDDRALRALESIQGEARGVNLLPRARIGDLLRAFGGGHPRVWLGKKERVGIRAATERPAITVQTLADGSLELKMDVERNRTGDPLPLVGWSRDQGVLIESIPLPRGFSANGTRRIERAQAPDFLTREWPELERFCDLVLAPGSGEFRLEQGVPTIEARLEGALAGLTLDLAARYGPDLFPLGAKSDSSDEKYRPDPGNVLRFWRRDLRAERAAIAEAEAAGFKLGRGGATFGLTTEHHVARFLANTLPRWRRSWTLHFGARLEATLREIDVAQPEFALRSGSGEEWLSLDLALKVDGRPIALDPAEVQRWLQTGQTHTRTPDKRILLVPTEAWGEMREVLADAAVEQEPGKMRVARTFAPFVAEALTANGFRAVRDDSASAPPPEVAPLLDPKLWAQLRDYQARGVEWLAAIAARGGHALLADDMGLGKTLQALAFCAWLRARGKDRGPALVICPTSLVTNWLREAARFTPHLRTLDLTGPDRAERLAARGRADLLVTSYAVLRRDLDSYRADEFSLVVLDEAQHIKNRGSQNAHSAKALRARHRLALTGTPLENSVLDLWSLYDFLLPGYLGTAADFRERYETPLTRGVEPRTMARLRQRVRPWFLRRTKEEVLSELPPKLEHLTLCELSDEQREVYRAVLEQGRREVFEKSGKAGGGRNRIAVLTTLLRLRQVCCHLGMLPSGDDPPREWREPSAKLERTFELIDEAIDGGHRVLLFSQFVRALHLLRDEARRRDLRFCYLDGQTVERQAEVDRFQDDAGIPIFFISLKAGGTGLNLTGADTVIHFDPWWNPAVEEQATARAHRLGQASVVQAYKLIAAGTVEEKIQALQARKLELFQASVGDEALVESLTGDELEELLTDPS